MQHSRAHGHGHERHSHGVSADADRGAAGLALAPRLQARRLGRVPASLAGAIGRQRAAATRLRSPGSGPGNGGRRGVDTGLDREPPPRPCAASPGRGPAVVGDHMADARLAPRHGEGGDGLPRAALGRADAPTLARFWLVPLLPAARRHQVMLTIVIVTGAISDWVDGHLARQDGRTRLGRDLDSTADLVFVTTAAIALHRAGRLSSLGTGADG